MLGISALGIATSAAVSAPTVLSLYGDRLNERAVFWGSLAARALGIPLVFYGNAMRSDRLIAAASLLMITRHRLAVAASHETSVG